ncbi:MAG: hypothetical protein GEU28_11030 [Dehalococcoidia bacterium]|nr:hypothetical protein [Dehalococcoidia bacterium]
MTAGEAASSAGRAKPLGFARDRADSLTASRLLVFGVASAVVCLVLTSQTSFLEFFPGDYGTSIFLPQMVTDWREAFLGFLVAYIALWIAFAMVLLALRGRDGGRATLAVLFAMPVVFTVILTFMYPPWSLDFVHNVQDARTLWLFGENPMVVPPHGNPFPVLQYWGHLPAPYGPLWFLLLFPVTVAGESVDVALHVLKFYQGLYYLGSALLVYLIVREISPGRQLFAFALYAWNPFVFLRVTGNGHNDLTIVFFVLVAVWLLVQGRTRITLAALAASALSKYVSLLLAPPLLLGAYLHATDKRAFWRETALGAALALVLAIAVFSVLWEGEETFDSLRQQSELLANSPALFLQSYLIFDGMSVGQATDIARWTAFSVFGVVYAALLLAYWRSPRRINDLLACMSLVLLAYVAIGSVWYMPWYLIWPLTLMILVPGRWGVAMSIAMSLGGMFPDFVMWYGNRLGLEERVLWHIGTIVSMSFGLVALTWLVGIVRTRRLLPVDA